MSIARRSDGRHVVKFKDVEGRWRQRSFRSEEEARQFDAEGRSAGESASLCAHIRTAVNCLIMAKLALAAAMA